MTDINVNQLAESINDKADLNLLNTSNNVDVVIESQLPTAENNYTWYRIYKSGWVEQGGLDINYYTSGWSNDETFVLPVPMNNINYNIFWMGGWTAYVDHDTVVKAKTTTSFTISAHVNHSTQGQANWEVKGQGASL